MSRVVKAMRFTYLNFAISSFVIGAAATFDPIGFWAYFDIHLGDPIIGTVYGAAIIGEGIVCLYGYWEPARAVGVLLYMVSYKTAMILALVPRLASMPDAPWGGWLIVGAWAVAAVWAAAIIPWRRWDELVAETR